MELEMGTPSNWQTDGGVPSGIYYPKWFCSSHQSSVIYVHSAGCAANLAKRVVFTREAVCDGKVPGWGGPPP